MTRFPLACCLLLAASVSATAAPNIGKSLDGVRAAVNAGNYDTLAAHLRAVLEAGGKPAAKGLIGIIQKFPAGKAPMYWPVVNALASLSDEKALKTVGDFLVKNHDTPQAKDVLFGLQNNRSAGVLEVYRKIFKKKGNQLRLLACDRLGEHAKPEAVDILLEGLEKEDGKGTALERRIKTTLTALFGEDMGDLVNWQGYWEANRETAFTKQAGGHGGTGTVRDQLDATRAGGLKSMSRRGGKVIVLRSLNKNFDSIENMLSRLKVEHTVVMKQAFMDDMEGTLKGVAAVILNCNFYTRVCWCQKCTGGAAGGRLPRCNPACGVHDYKHDMLKEVARDRLKKFVEEGGSVFTEDWGLKELTSKAWPEYVAVGPDLNEQKVDYAPVPGQTGTPLLRGVMARKGNGASSVRRVETSWKVDNLSPSIKVVDPAKVQVLLASEKLKELEKAAGNPDGAGAVALVFSPGEGTADADKGARRPMTGGKRRRKSRRGKGEPAPTTGIVLHVLSHFGKQGTKEDEFTLQNLLVNWLLEAQERYAAARAAK